MLNAAYFKANWAAAFDKAATKKAAFWLSPQTSAPVTTLHQTGSFGIVKGDGFRAIRLPCGRKAQDVIVVLDAIDGAGHQCQPCGKLRADVDNPRARRVDLSLPKFKFSYDAGSWSRRFRRSA